MRGVTFEKFVGNAERIFQLTRLMRGVTFEKFVGNAERIFQLTRLMRGVTADAPQDDINELNFNSHASCEA